MITELGGAVAVPSAVRSSDSTTTMRVNDVIMIRIDGAIDSTVSSAISWIARSVTPPPPWPRLMLISCASAGSASDPAAIRIRKNNTLRGEAGSLTKGSLDGPAGTPSRLRDFRSRSSAERGGGTGARCGALRRAGGVSGATGGATGSAGRRRAASSRCAISARFWSALDGAGAGGGGGGGGGARRVRRRRRTVADGRLADRRLAALAASRIGMAALRELRHLANRRYLGQLALRPRHQRLAAGQARRARVRRGRRRSVPAQSPSSGSLRRSGIGGGAGRRTSSAKEGRAGRGGGSGICGSA